MGGPEKGEMDRSRKGRKVNPKCGRTKRWRAGEQTDVKVQSSFIRIYWVDTFLLDFLNLPHSPHPCCSSSHFRHVQFPSPAMDTAQVLPQLLGQAWILLAFKRNYKALVVPENADFGSASTCSGMELGELETSFFFFFLMIIYFYFLCSLHHHSIL